MVLTNLRPNREIIRILASHIISEIFLASNIESEWMFIGILGPEIKADLENIFPTPIEEVEIFTITGGVNNQMYICYCDRNLQIMDTVRYYINKEILINIIEQAIIYNVPIIDNIPNLKINWNQRNNLDLLS